MGAARATLVDVSREKQRRLSRRLRTALRVARACPQDSYDDLARRNGYARSTLTAAVAQARRSDRGKVPLPTRERRLIDESVGSINYKVVRAALARGVWSRRRHYSDEFSVTRERIASDPATPRAVVAHFAASARDEHWMTAPGVERSAASNPSAPVWLLFALVEGSDSARHVVAANPGADKRLLGRIVRNPDTDAETRVEVALNPSAAGFAALLARDESPEVRSAVAERGDNPLTLQRLLAGDASAEVPMAVASNQSTAPDVVAGLAASDVAKVRGRAAANPALGDAGVRRLACDESSSVRAALGGRPLPPDVVSLLAGDAVAKVRAAVVAAGACSREDCERLASDESPGVRAAVARIGDIGVFTQSRLVSDPHHQVAKAARRRSRQQRQ